MERVFGMRKSEFVGLRITDIDFDKNEVHIKRSVFRTSDGNYHIKRNKIDRTVPLNESLKEPVLALGNPDPEKENCVWLYIANNMISL